jgi:hypothetical protein
MRSIRSLQFGPMAKHVIVGLPPNSVCPASVTILTSNPILRDFSQMSSNSASLFTRTHTFLVPVCNQFAASSEI